MRTCTNCQAPLFEEPACLICGKPADDAPRPAASPSSAMPAGQPGLTIEQLRSGTATKAGPMSEDAACALCYVLFAVSGLAMLVVPAYRQNKTVRFHAIQSILLTPLWLWGFAVTAMFGPEEYRDKMMWGLELGALFTWFFMIAISAIGRGVSLPVIGYLARKEL